MNYSSLSKGFCEQDPKEYKKNNINQELFKSLQKRNLEVMKNHKHSNFIKFQKKSFLEKIYKGFFESLNLESIQRPEEFATIYEPIVFENRRFKVLECDSSVPEKISKIVSFIVNPLILFFGYKLAMGIYALGLIRSLFWTTLLFYFLRIRVGIKNNKEYIIKEINVYEDGKTCEIVTLKKSFDIDINKIRKINFEEAMFMKKSLDSLKVNYIPIVLDTKLYLIPLLSNIPRKDILGSICDGKYIKFQEIINNDKTIQI